MCETKLEKKELISLYSEQWKQIRHLDNLDMRIMTLVPIVVAIVTLAVNIVAGDLSRASTDTQYITGVVKSLFFISAIIVLGVSFIGCYTTLRNWICYMRRMNILTALEKQIGMVELNIIEKNIQFTPPQDFLKFMQYFRQSIRFPLSILYALLGGISIIIFQKAVSFASFFWMLVVAITIFSYCIRINYKSYKNQFLNKT